MSAHAKPRLVPKTMRKRIHAEVERHGVHLGNGVDCTICGALPVPPSETPWADHMVDVAIDTTVRELAKARRWKGAL